MRRALVVVVAGLVLVVLATATVFGGRNALYRIRASAYDSPMRFGLAPVHPEFAPGLPAELTGARILQGQLQVVASVGHCDAVSALSVHESAVAVRISVRASGLDKVCTAEVIPVYVNVHLKRPLGDRTLIDVTSGRTLDVDVCESRPEPHARLCSPGWYGL